MVIDTKTSVNDRRARFFLLAQNCLPPVERKKNSRNEHNANNCVCTQINSSVWERWNLVCTIYRRRVFPTRITSLCVCAIPFPRPLLQLLMPIPKCISVWCNFYSYSIVLWRKKVCARPMKFSNKLNGNAIKSREFAILKQFLLCVCYLHDLTSHAARRKCISIHNSLSMESLAILSRSQHIIAFSKHYCICSVSSFFVFGSTFSLFKWIHFISVYFIFHANRK